MEALKNIIQLKGGSKKRLAHELRLLKPDTKICGSHIHNWIVRDKKIPPEWILPLAAVCNYEYTPHQINKEIYPNPDDALPHYLKTQLACEA
jgi:hypothetical protein